MIAAAVLLILTVGLVVIRSCGSTTGKPGAYVNPAGPAPTPRYKVGDSALSGGLRVTVFGVHDPEPPDRVSATPLGGYHFVGVDVQVANPTGAALPFSSLTAFHLVDQINHETPMTIVQGRASPTANGQFAAGQSIRGLVLFQLLDHTTSLRLRFQASVNDPGVVYVLN